MKPAEVQREVVTSGVLSEQKFGISIKDQVHIMRIMRDKLYSDKPLAVLREYGANAWDAHREAGCPERPIQVTLPTSLENSLIIRDFGPGLSEKEIYEVFVQYGASSKRESNEGVGMFGIGAKSAFSYNDQYSVTSWHDGTKSVYSGVLDESDMGVMSKLWEEPCSADETGVEIKVPVRPKDRHLFLNKARTLYSYFAPQPEINIDLPTPMKDLGPLGAISPKGIPGSAHQWVAVMGCVPYTVSWVDLADELKERDLTVVAEKLYGILRFDVGDVDISASREALEYTDKTKAAILSKVDALVESISAGLIEAVNKARCSWEARELIWKYREETGLPAPERFKGLRGTTGLLYTTEEPALTFTAGRTEWYHPSGRGAGRMRVGKDPRVFSRLRERIIIRDVTGKPLRGYLDQHSVAHYVVITPKPGVPLAEARAELDAIIKDKQWDGIPVDLLSSYPYVPVSRRNGGSANAKHSKRTFTLNIPNLGYRNRKASNYWNLAEEPPSENSVFVILDRFMSDVRTRSYYGNFRLAGTYLADQNVVKHFLGQEMPTIYGIKSTERRPVRREDVAGIHYDDWADQLYASLERNKEAHYARLVWQWATISAGVSNPKRAFAYSKDALDGRHNINQFLRRHWDAQDLLRSLEQEQKEALQQLSEGIRFYYPLRKDKRRKKTRTPRRDNPATVPMRAFAAIRERYPLLSKKNGGPGLAALENKKVRDLWVEYIEMADQKLKTHKVED